MLGGRRANGWAIGVAVSEVSESVKASRASLQAWGSGGVCDIVVIEDIKVGAGQLCIRSLAASQELHILCAMRDKEKGETLCCCGSGVQASRRAIGQQNKIRQTAPMSTHTSSHMAI